MRPSVFLFLSCLAICFLGIVAQQKYIHVAEFATDAAHLEFINPGGRRVYSDDDTLSLRNGYRLWADLVNENGGIMIGGENYLVNLTEHYIGDASTPALVSYAINVVNEVATGIRGPADVFFAPFGSALSNVTATALEPHGKLMIAAASTSSANLVCDAALLPLQPPCTKPETPRFRYFFSVSGKAGDVLKTSTQFLSVRPEVRTAAFWKEDTPYLHEVVKTSVSVARQNNIGILADMTISLTPTYEQVREVAKEMKRINPDVVLAGNFYGACKFFVQALKEIDYAPKALLMPLCIDVPGAQEDLGDLSEYLLGVALWDQRLTGVSYEDKRYFLPQENVGSSMLFYQRYQAEFGMAPSVFSALAVQAGYTLQEVLLKTDSSNDTEAWVDSMLTVQFNCFFGNVQFNGFHQNIGATTLTLQQINNTLEIVDPLSAATTSVVFPMPPWKARVFSSVYLGTPTEMGIVAFGMFVALLLIALAGIVVTKRKEAVIAAASPAFCILILGGSMLPILGIFMWMFHSETYMCYLRIWFFNLSFAIVYGAIFTKTWRVLRVFMNKTLKARNVSLREIFTIEGVIVGIEVIVCIVWSVVSRPSAQLIVVDPVYLNKNYIACVSAVPTADLAMFGISATYKLAMLLAGVIITYRVRKVKYLLFNESKWIGYSMYNLFVFLAILLPLQFMNTERETLFFIRSIFVILLILATNLFIFAPKLRILFGPQKGGTILMSTINANSEIMTVNDGGMGQTIVDDKGALQVDKLNDEIADFKKKVKRQEAHIKDLERTIAKLKNGGDVDLTSTSDSTVAATNKGNKTTQQMSDASFSSSSITSSEMDLPSIKPSKGKVSDSEDG